MCNSLLCLGGKGGVRQQPAASGAAGLQRPERTVRVQDTGAGGESQRVCYSETFPPDALYGHILQYILPIKLISTFLIGA